MTSAVAAPFLRDGRTEEEAARPRPRAAHVPAARSSSIHWAKAANVVGFGLERRHMNDPQLESDDRGREAVHETDEELIERLLAKAELDHRCCGSHCSNFNCAGEAR